jgi:dihydropteroate synthase
MPAKQQRVSEREQSGRAAAWSAATGARLMAIVNVTPDSFSDGGRFLDPQAAIAQGMRTASEGAAIVDVGGESTRPGAERVQEAQECDRVLPVIEGLVASGCSAQISIDTCKAGVARRALAAGASFVNDVSALRFDPQMAECVAESGADCCLVHMRGEPRTMQQDPRYGDVVAEVKRFLAERMEFAVAAGIEERRIVLDPGIGFGKSVAHNLRLLARLAELSELGRPILIGVSRKSFIGAVGAQASALAEPLSVDARLAGTIAANVLAFERGARIFRVHEIAPARDALALAAATLAGDG